MGADLLLACVYVPEDAELDWQAGHRYIDATENFYTPIANTYAEEELSELRDELHGKLEELEHAHGRRDFVSIDVPGGSLWITGGTSYGDSPTDLWDAIADQEPAVLDVVGFRDSTGLSLVPEPKSS